MSVSLIVAIAPLFAFVSASVMQAPVLTGEVRDSVSRAPVARVLVVDLGTRQQTLTDVEGRFRLAARAPDRLRFSRAGYASREVDIASDAPLLVELAPSARSLEAVAITALRGRAGDDAAPISQRTLTRDEIEQRSFGQDVPLLLQSAPSLTSYAETGTYWGYSYIRLRGIDQSRINLTLDGIPLNDPEDQVLYFADFPDLANSLESVQIQRGVGTSSGGTAAYAGSINLETTPLAAARRGGELQLSGGSFDTRRLSADTWRGSAEYHSGLLPNRFAFYARASALQSDGYRYHSGVLGRSLFMSGGYFGDRDIVKVMATAGLFRDTLSYLAVPVGDLARDRRINPLQPSELDRFGEQLASISHTRLLSPSSSLQTTAYRISASGNYDVAIDPELWNFHLDFVWYGLSSAWNYQRERLRASGGINANTYSRDHYAFVRPDLGQPLYFNTGHKRDASGFAKIAYDLGRATLFADVQARWAEFRYTPDAAAGISGSAISWAFLNPKAGLTYQLTPFLQVYGSYGRNSREPARNDMFGGFDNLDTSNVAFVGGYSRVRPETVHDVEAGLVARTSVLDLQGNLFSMQFRNEIAPIGALSYLGLPLRKNVRASERRGIELDVAYRGIPRVTLGGNGTFMHSRIAEYSDDATGATFRDVEPLLTPWLVSNQRVTVAATRTLSLTFEGRYVSRSQLDNTGSASLVLPSAYTLDAGLSWHTRRGALIVRVNNIADSQRFSSGYGSGGTPYYFVLPPRNVIVTMKVGM